MAFGVALGDRCLVLLIITEFGTEEQTVSFQSSSTFVEDESTGLEDTTAVGIEDDRTSRYLVGF